MSANGKNTSVTAEQWAREFTASLTPAPDVVPWEPVEPLVKRKRARSPGVTSAKTPPVYAWQEWPWRQALHGTAERDPRKYPWICWLHEGQMGRPVQFCSTHFLASPAEMLNFICEVPLLMQVGGGSGASLEQRDDLREYWRGRARRRLAGDLRIDEVENLTKAWKALGGTASTTILRAAYCQEHLSDCVGAFLRGERSLEATVKRLQRGIREELFSFEVATWPDLLRADAFEHVRESFSETQEDVAVSSRGRTLIPPASQDAFIKFLRDGDGWSPA